MDSIGNEVVEESLDPEDWSSLRSLGHRMVDDLLEHLSTVRERPAWQPIPGEVRKRFAQPLPTSGAAPETVYQDYLDWVRPWPPGNLHPRFWGWVIGTGTPFTALAEMLAAGLNPNVSGFDDAPALVEDQVIDWCRQLMGFPEGASGLLVSGASMANLHGLAVARNRRAGFDVRRVGLASGPPLTLYASKETHSSVVKAVELLGLGRQALRLLPTGADFRLDVDALELALAEDRAAGRRPFCIVANAGTVNTGAVDDLPRLADLARRQQLWLHVDGAFGAFAALAPSLRERVAGIERADSLAFDLHKWGHFPIEAGCLLVRRDADQLASFQTSADYLSVTSGGVSGRQRRFAEYGLQLTRGFRALKVWMGLKQQGVDRLGRLVEQNVAQARELAARVDREPELERMAPVPLNIVCLRYRGGERDPEALDALNRRLLVQLQESGTAVPSHTLIGGRFALRVCLTNHRTRRADLALLVEKVLELGRALEARGAEPKETER